MKKLHIGNEELHDFTSVKDSKMDGRGGGGLDEKLMQSCSR
jgi:hypothetical protein